MLGTLTDLKLPGSAKYGPPHQSDRTDRASILGSEKTNREKLLARVRENGSTTIEQTSRIKTQDIYAALEKIARERRKGPVDADICRFEDQISRVLSQRTIPVECGEKVVETSQLCEAHQPDQTDRGSVLASGKTIRDKLLARVRDTGSTIKQTPCIKSQDINAALFKIARERRKVPLDASTSEGFANAQFKTYDEDKVSDHLFLESDIGLPSRRSTPNITSYRDNGATRRGFRRTTSARHLSQRKKLLNGDGISETQSNAVWIAFNEAGNSDSTTWGMMSNSSSFNDSGSLSTSLHGEKTVSSRRTTVHKQRSFKRSSSSRLTKNRSFCKTDSDDSETLGASKSSIDLQSLEISDDLLVEPLDISYRRSGLARRRLGKSMSARFGNQGSKRILYKCESKVEDDIPESIDLLTSPSKHKITAMSPELAASPLWNSDSLLLSGNREVTARFQKVIAKILKPEP